MKAAFGLVLRVVEDSAQVPPGVMLLVVGELLACLTCPLVVGSEIGSRWTILAEFVGRSVDYALVVSAADLSRSIGFDPLLVFGRGSVSRNWEARLEGHPWSKR